MMKALAVRAWLLALPLLFPAAARAQLLLKAPASAVSAAPSTGFVPDYLTTLSKSMEQDPYFASRLLGGLDHHLEQVKPMTSPQHVADYLKDRITAGRKGIWATARVKAAIGTSAMDAEQASALLLANALARPDQFQEVLRGMERIRPSWGQHASHLLKDTGPAPGASPAFLNILRGLGDASKPAPFPGIYDASGKLQGLFDGG